MIYVRKRIILRYAQMYYKFGDVSWNTIFFFFLRGE